MAGRKDLTGLLAVLRPAPSVLTDLRRRMTAPGRLYHGPEHLGLLWARHRRLGRGSAVGAPGLRRLVAAAIAFHDLVLVPGRPDNEAQSARLWRQAARRGAGFTRAEVDWVAGTILATRDHLALPVGRSRLDLLRAWVIDLDLSPLGEAPGRFRRNTDHLRREAARCAGWPDPAGFERGRIGFLQRLAQAPTLYHCRRIRRAFEPSARANIARALAEPRPALP
jgi:predicted metal-dependent HD superfamily phosphohydrolase